MYVPSYLLYLNRSTTPDGWPSFADEAGKAFAVARVREGLAKYGRLSLDLASNVIFDGLTSEAAKPASLVGVALWDARYALTHRALLAAGAQQVWVAPQGVATVGEADQEAA